MDKISFTKIVNNYQMSMASVEMSKAQAITDLGVAILNDIAFARIDKSTKETWAAWFSEITGETIDWKHIDKILGYSRCYHALATDGLDLLDCQQIKGESWKTTLARLKPMIMKEDDLEVRTKMLTDYIHYSWQDFLVIYAPEKTDTAKEELKKITDEAKEAKKAVVEKIKAKPDMPTLSTGKTDAKVATDAKVDTVEVSYSDSASQCVALMGGLSNSDKQAVMNSMFPSLTTESLNQILSTVSDIVATRMVEKAEAQQEQAELAVETSEIKEVQTV